MICVLGYGQMMAAPRIDVRLFLQESGVTTEPCIDLCPTSHQSDWLPSIQEEEKRNTILKQKGIKFEAREYLYQPQV